MSTTVIVSRIGRPLAFASWATPSSIDGEALRLVLERHGVEAIPGTHDGIDFIAAEGLDPIRAADLAQDLRALGLMARVENQTGLTESQRVANALEISLAAVFFIAPFLALALVLASTLGALVAGLPLLWFALNAALIAWRGGSRLDALGAVRSTDALGESERLADSLRDELPEPVLRSILHRARELELEARRDPEGPAAAELAALMEDDTQRRRTETLAKARSLRDEVQRARLAASEVRKLQ